MTNDIATLRASEVFPHVPAAFINAIREEGSKAEACDWLQKVWNENCALRGQLAQAAKAGAEGRTPAAHWREKGEPDPHGDRFDCERAALPKGHLTDDEIANGIYMADRSSLDLIAWQEAAKQRIRWLSRKLCEVR